MICPVCKTPMTSPGFNKIFVGSCPSCGLHLDQSSKKVFFEEKSPQWCKDSLKFLYDFQKFHPDFVFSSNDIFTPDFKLSEVIFITPIVPTDSQKPTELSYETMFEQLIPKSYKLIGGHGYLKWGLVDLLKSVFIHKDAGMFDDSICAGPFARLLLKALWATYPSQRYNLDEIVVVNALLRRTFEEMCQDLFQCMPGDKVLPLVTDEEALYSVLFNNFPSAIGLISDAEGMRERMVTYALGILSKTYYADYVEATYDKENEPKGWNTNDKLRYELLKMFLDSMACTNINNKSAKGIGDIVTFDIIDGDFKNTPFVTPIWQTCPSSAIQKLLKGYRNLPMTFGKPELPYDTLGLAGKRKALEEYGIKTAGCSNNWIVYKFWKTIAADVLTKHNIPLIGENAE